jgi:hyperosmotically inducible periplasmic protein
MSKGFYMWSRIAVVAAVSVLAMGTANPALAQAPTAASQGAEASLVAAVKKALSNQSDLRRLTVTAAGQDVTLAGRLPSLWHKQEAVKRALKVPGVKNVVSEIQLPKPESDLDLAYRIGPTLDRYPYYTMFDYVDAVIKGGVVTLTGSVTPDMNKAEDIAEEISRVRGIVEIRNQIETLPPSQGDNDIRSSLYSRIFDNEHFIGLESQKVPPFHIVVKNGNITLYGRVQGEIEYRELEQIAKFTPGVQRVTNNLTTVTKIKR